MNLNLSSQKVHFFDLLCSLQKCNIRNIEALTKGIYSLCYFIFLVCYFENSAGQWTDIEKLMEDAGTKSVNKILEDVKTVLKLKATANNDINEQISFYNDSINKFCQSVGEEVSVDNISKKFPLL